MSSTTIKYFDFAHLPPKLQTVSLPIGVLAEKLEALLPDGPEKSAGMRKLLEAKDCFVRCAIDLPVPFPSMDYVNDLRKAVQPHQRRVLAERDELKDNHSKLSAFILDNPIFLNLPEAEQARLQKQEQLQAQLLGVLDERISGF